MFQSDKKIERADLTTVGVPRELKIDAREHRLSDLLGLMREEQDGQRRVGPREGCLEIRSVSAHTGRLCGGVVHAGHNEPVTAALDDHVSVVQSHPADALHVVQPTLGLAEVLVIAGDVDARQRGIRRSERTRLQFAYLDRPVSDIADVADEVGAELVDPRHHGRRPPRAIDRPVVRVGITATRRPSMPGPSRAIETSTFFTRGTRIASA